jgi:hypothetical protein
MTHQYILVFGCFTGMYVNMLGMLYVYTLCAQLAVPYAMQRVTAQQCC